MCRFLIIKSNSKFNPQQLLTEFSRMCQRSRAPDGDWQGDGFGIAWKKGGEWQLLKSLQPIWRSQKIFTEVPSTTLLVAHARSSGFPQHKGNLDYNQPYLNGDLCFVFNGMIRGVKMSLSLEGKIGAQKIFSLIKHFLKDNNADAVLRKINLLLANNTVKIEGMNIGLVQRNKFHILCQYSDNDEYFGVRFYQDRKWTIVCSQAVGNYNFIKMKKGEVVSL